MTFVLFGPTLSIRSTLLDTDYIVAGDLAADPSGATARRIPGTALVKKDASGNVGIGTASPLAKLHAVNSLAISESSGAQHLLMGNRDSVGAGGPAIIRSANKIIEFGVGNSWAAGANGGAFTSFGSIQANGFLGLGVTPTALLHVRTAIDATKAIIGGVSKAVRVQTTATDTRLEGVSHDNASFQPLVIGGSLVSMSESGSITFNFSGGHLLPSTDNIRDLGSGALRMRVIYAGTGAINTSDKRLKKEIGEIPDAWLDAWADVKWQRFKFKDGNRWHVGLIAQDVHAAFAEHDLDAFEIGLCCFDKWDEQREPIFATRKKIEKYEAPSGEVYKSGSRKGEPKMETLEREIEETYDTGETRITLEAGDRWGLRYDECQAIEAAWQRREISRMAARLAALEA